MPDDSKPEDEIKGDLGDLEEIREAARRLGISYDLPLSTFAEIANGDSPTFRLRASEELAKILRMYPERGANKTVVKTDAQEVRIYLPDNGRGDKPAKDDE